MKAVDVIFAFACGRVVGFLLGDFLRAWDVALGWQYQVVVWLGLPFFTIFCLWLAHVMGKKVLFIFQGAKFLLVGAFATVIDLKFFEASLWVLSFFAASYPLVVKGISFLIATLIKFWGNKYWAFAKHEKENIRQEVVQFFFVTAIGLAIDVCAFYYFTRVLGPQLAQSHVEGFQLSPAVWLKLSVIFAALAAALWNFIGYKHFVFKK